MFRLEVEGDIPKTSAMLTQAALRMRGVARDNVFSFAQQIRQELVSGIQQSKFQLLQLTPAYQEKKDKVYGSKPILIATSEYVDAIKVLGTASDQEIGVGFEPGQRNLSGQPLERVATSLEFGTSRMGARPHWRPIAEQAQRTIVSVGQRTYEGIGLPK